MERLMAGGLVGTFVVASPNFALVNMRPDLGGLTTNDITKKLVHRDNHRRPRLSPLILRTMHLLASLFSSPVCMHASLPFIYISLIDTILCITGTDIYLSGHSNAAYTVTIDGIPHIFPPTALDVNTLGQFNGLLNQNHTLSIAVHGIDDNQLSFEGATVTINLGGYVIIPHHALKSGIHARNFSRQPVHTAYDSSDPSLVYSGDWSQQDTGDVPSVSSHSVYRHTSSSGSSASLDFIGRAIMLRGTANITHGEYQVVCMTYYLLIRHSNI